MRLEELQKGDQIPGLIPGETVSLASVDETGPNAVTVIARRADGSLEEQLLTRADEARISIATAGRSWVFDADAY